MDGPHSTLTPADAACRRWDVIVVGAGPAGSAAACAVAASGSTVLLLDRARFPRTKVCGCCVSAAGVAALRAMGAETGLGGVALRRLDLRVGTRRAAVSISGGMAVSREVLDAALIRRAVTNGAHFLDGTAGVVQPDLADRAAIVVRRDGASFSLTAHCVVVADGLGGGALAERPEFTPVVRAGGRIGVGATLPPRAAELCSGVVMMCVGAGAYVGLVRLADGQIDLAASISPASARAAGGPGAVIQQVLAASGIEVDLAGVRFAGTPLLTRRRRVGLGRVLIAGDAAGYADPFSGEGMTWAIRAGGAVAHHALAAARGDSRAAARWRGQFGRDMQPRLMRSRVLAGVAASPVLARAGAWGAGVLPCLAATAARAFFSGDSQSTPAVA